MKTFYVLWDGTHYLQNSFPDGYPNSYSEYLGDAEQFESLCQALEFMDSSGLQLEVLRVDITSSYTPNLFTEKS